MLALHGMRDLKIKLIDVNPFITCGICGGYFVNATTITECMHTFCKSCLILHIRFHNSCPLCQRVIHPSQPLRAIRADQTLQDIVYKLVPGLREDEQRREAEFNEKSGQPASSKVENKRDVDVDLIRRNFAIRLSELLHICMESMSEHVPALGCKYMIVPRRSTILHLKKFVASKILNDDDKWNDVDIYCDGELQGKEHSIEFVYVTRWKKQSPILVLHYFCQMPVTRLSTTLPLNM